MSCKKAAEENRLALLPVELVLAREGKYSAREIADETGQDVEAMRRPAPGASACRWSLDLDAKAFTEDDLQAARRATGLRGGRLSGGGHARGQPRHRRGRRRGWPRRFATWSADSLLRPGDTERDVGLRYAEVARETAPLLGPVLEYVLNQHLVEQIRDDVISRAELEAGQILPDARDMAVCFADLSGFTRLGEVAPVEEVGAVAGRLAAMATEVAGGPVRLVKTIG